MIELILNRKKNTTSGFLEYDLAVHLNKKVYDLNMHFLIFTQVIPNGKINFCLRPQAGTNTYEGSRSPVKGTKVVDNMLQYEWYEEISEIRRCLNTLAFPLTPKDNVELFTFCFCAPLRFSSGYQAMLEKLKADAAEANKEFWSVPRWQAVDKRSMVPLGEVPEKADQFFQYALSYRLRKAGYKIKGWGD